MRQRLILAVYWGITFLLALAVLAFALR